MGYAWAGVDDREAACLGTEKTRSHALRNTRCRCRRIQLIQCNYGIKIKKAPSVSGRRFEINPLVTQAKHTWIFEQSGFCATPHVRLAPHNRWESVDLTICVSIKSGIWRTKPPNPDRLWGCRPEVWARFKLVCCTWCWVQRLPLSGFSCVVQANHARRKNFTGDKRQIGFGLYIFENRDAVPKQNWINIEPVIIN